MNEVFQNIIMFGMAGGAILILIIILSEFVNYVQTRVPFVPTSKIDIEDMSKRLQISSEDLFIDLGSGNGKIVFAIENLTGARARGLQRRGWTQSYAKLRKLLTSSKSEFISGNFFDQSWSDATIIYCYLYPHLMNQVAEKALVECRSGTKIVVRDFPIKSLAHKETWRTPSNHEMFLYIV